MRSDPTLSATHRREGVMMVRTSGVELGQPRTADLRDAAPTILDLLGIAPGPDMTGRSLCSKLTGSLRCDSAQRLDVRGGVSVRRESDDSGELTADEQAVVEERLRELGYIE
jgi:hypothetical protein